MDGDQVSVAGIGDVRPPLERDRPVGLPRERRLELRVGVEDRLQDVRDPQGHVRLAEPRGRVDRARILAAVARVDHESDLRAGRHASTFVLFRDRRTVEVWNRSPDPQRFEDWKNGSSGRIRTYNPPVNSRMLCR